MRDYGNMPVLDWTVDKAPLKAKAQIIHEEPVILQMPATFDTSLDAESFSGKLHEETGILYDCDGSRVLSWLATRNHEPDLNIIAEACAYSNSLVDIDGTRKRLIVHD
jgi:hypothetical protein